MKEKQVKIYKNKAEVDNDKVFKAYIEAVAISEVVSPSYIFSKLIESKILPFTDVDPMAYLVNVQKKADDAHWESLKNASHEFLRLEKEAEDKYDVEILSLDEQVKELVAKRSKLGPNASDEELAAITDDIYKKSTELSIMKVKRQGASLLGKDSWRMKYKHKKLRHVRLETPEGAFDLGFTPAGDVYDAERVKLVDEDGGEVDFGWCAKATAKVYKVFKQSNGKSKRLSINVGGKYFNLTKLMYNSFFSDEKIQDWQFRVTYDNWLFIPQNFSDVIKKPKKHKMPISVIPRGFDSEQDSTISELAQLFASWDVGSIDEIVDVTGIDKLKYAGALANKSSSELLEALVGHTVAKITRARNLDELSEIIGDYREMTVSGKKLAIFTGGLCVEVRVDSLRHLNIIDVDGKPYYKGLPKVEVGVYLAKAFLTKKMRPVLKTVTDRRLTVVGNIFVVDNEGYEK